jgi:hypothetical protein
MWKKLPSEFVINFTSSGIWRRVQSKFELGGIFVGSRRFLAKAMSAYFFQEWLRHTTKKKNVHHHGVFPHSNGHLQKSKREPLLCKWKVFPLCHFLKSHFQKVFLTSAQQKWKFPLYSFTLKLNVSYLPTHFYTISIRDITSYTDWTPPSYTRAGRFMPRDPRTGSVDGVMI